MIASRLTVPSLGHLAKAENRRRENESVVMIMVVELQTLPWILLHVNRRLSHVSIGVQEVAAHQQSELFWRLHLQNVPRRWKEVVCSSETLPPTYPSTHQLTLYYHPPIHLPIYLTTGSLNTEDLGTTEHSRNSNVGKFSHSWAPFYLTTFISCGSDCTQHTSWQVKRYLHLSHNPNFRYRVYRTPTSDPIQSQTSLAHLLTRNPLSFKDPASFSSTLRLRKGPFVCVFRFKDSVHLPQNSMLATRSTQPGNIIVLYISIFASLDSRSDGKEFWTAG